nr:hypothetical protein [Tanacetum cinerariifolium]
NPPYKFMWADKEVPISEGIDNDIYSTVDACPNACEMWKAIERLKQGESINHQNEVNEIGAERIAQTANPLAIVAQQQPVYHPQNHPTHYTQNSSTRSQQAATRNIGKAIVNSPQPIYDQELLWLLKMMKQVSPDAADSGPIFDDEPLQKVSNDDHYNVFAIESEHPKKSKSVHDTYPIEQDGHNVIIDSLDMSYDRE